MRTLCRDLRVRVSLGQTMMKASARLHSWVPKPPQWRNSNSGRGIASVGWPICRPWREVPRLVCHWRLRERHTGVEQGSELCRGQSPFAVKPVNGLIRGYVGFFSAANKGVMVRKGGFERPLQCIFNDLQGLGRPIKSPIQYKGLLMGCKRDVDSADSAAAPLVFLAGTTGTIRPELPSLPVQPFLNVRRTPLLQCRNRSAGFSRANTNTRFSVTLQKRVPQGHATDRTSFKTCQNRITWLLRRQRATSAEEKMSRFFDNSCVHRYDGTFRSTPHHLPRPSTHSFLRNGCDDRAMR